VAGTNSSLWQAGIASTAGNHSTTEVLRYMGKHKGAEQEFPLDCRTCRNWREVKERVRLLELLEAAIDKMQKALMEEGFKPTVGDYAKLVQMEKELDEAVGETKEIKVTWVEPENEE